MNTEPTSSEMHRRLEALEERFRDLLKRVTAGGAAPAHHRERIEDIEGKTSAVREKLAKGGTAEEGSAWDHLKGEVNEDLDILGHALERWAEHVDREYKEER